MENLGLDCWLTQGDWEPSLYMRELEVAVAFPLCVVEGPNPAQGRRENTTGSGTKRMTPNYLMYTNPHGEETLRMAKPCSWSKMMLISRKSF
jgi:hypothetical protein